MREEEMMFCGAGCLKDVDRDGELGGGGGKAAGKEEKKAAPEVDKTAKKTKKKKQPAGKKENPYASRGLDKFSTVVAELESRREKVLRRVDGGGSGDRVMVRFVQSEGKGWVPVVFKLPPEEQQPAADATGKGDSKKKCKPAAVCTAPTQPPTTTQRTTESTSTSPRDDDVTHGTAAAKATAAPAKEKKKKKKRWSWGRKAMRPNHYWPLVAVLLLVSLVVFGRVFAICCTSIWWYLVPILSGSDGDDEGQAVRRAMGKIGKKASDKKISEKLTWVPLPPSHGKTSSSGAHEVISPRSHAHGKKG